MMCNYESMLRLLRHFENFRIHQFAGILQFFGQINQSGMQKYYQKLQLPKQIVLQCNRLMPVASLRICFISCSRNKPHGNPKTDYQLKNLHCNDIAH